VLYWVLRWIAGNALRWYYRDIRVVGAERVPRTGPAIFAVNHPNALVDALVAGCVVPRRLRLTGKATLFEQPVLALLLRTAGVIPLRRVSDELKRRAQMDTAERVSSGRNAEAFRALSDVLAEDGAVLIFPEGKSHSEPSMAPLKTGIARIALEARDVRGVRGLCIVPIGLVFERKDLPRTRVLVQVGEPIAVDSFDNTAGSGRPVEALTALVEERLRDVTLNFSSPTHAARVLEIADLMAGVTAPYRTVDKADPELMTVLDVVRRIEQARVALENHGSPTELETRVDQFLARLDEYARELRRHGLAATDVQIETGVGPGAVFALREGAIMLVVGPAAGWGRLNHWIPLRAARAIALAGADSPDQPAMRTMVAGVALVLTAYALQTALVAQWAGPWLAFVYLATLPLFATWDLRLADRAERAFGRVRAYRLFRRDPALQSRLLAESGRLKAEAEAIEKALRGGR
jgi:1-acyl-sn-glycerol-3-phosphate acyltransferase